jgi:hypothetical protein
MHIHILAVHRQPADSNDGGPGARDAPSMPSPLAGKSLSDVWPPDRARLRRDFFPMTAEGFPVVAQRTQDPHECLVRPPASAMH